MFNFLTALNVLLFSDQQWAQTDYSDASNWGAFPAQTKSVSQIAPPSTFNETFGSGMT